MKIIPNSSISEEGPERNYSIAAVFPEYVGREQ